MPRVLLLSWVALRMVGDPRQAIGPSSMAGFLVNLCLSLEVPQLKLRREILRQLRAQVHLHVVPRKSGDLEENDQAPAADAKAKKWH